MTGDFASMRASLAERGLIVRVGDKFHLTDAGHAHVDAMLDELAQTEAANDRDGPRVRWDYRWRSRPAQEASVA